jgi:branched-chain amino acid transport system ATP-binding protein
VSALLAVEDVAVAFGGVHAVDGVSLDVAPGSIVGLIGPNGAGKTTLFNCISGLQGVDTGRIVLDGHDVTRLGAHERAARGIGRSFQNLGLMMDEKAVTNVLAAQHLHAGYRGLDIVARPRRWWRGERTLARRAAEALDTFGLAGHADRPVRDLSFATARFVELAAVAAADPTLMLLDEPTTGLDGAEIATLLGALRRIRESGTTVMVIAHDVGFVMDLCDHVYALASGRLLSQGPPAAVRNDPAVIDAYVGAGT